MVQPISLSPTGALRLAALCGAAVAAIAPASALAWGREGHEIVADIARAYLTPEAKAKVDAILASDPDTLTAPDMASRATWADVYREDHRETAAWHFVDIELSHPDLDAACFGFPPLAPGQPASEGAARDCVVHKVEAFERELAAATTEPEERAMALKFLLHFVGDLHQPLHASDDHDRGGNCVRISLGGARTTNLHSYWDTTVVEELGRGPARVAAELERRITPADVKAWQTGGPRSWAMETFNVARSATYTLGSPPGCSSEAAPISLPSGYDARARDVAARQLEKAGVRLAVVLNQALAHAPVPEARRDELDSGRRSLCRPQTADRSGRRLPTGCGLRARLRDRDVRSGRSLPFNPQLRTTVGELPVEATLDLHRRRHRNLGRAALVVGALARARFPGHAELGQGLAGGAGEAIVAIDHDPAGEAGANGLGVDAVTQLHQLAILDQAAQGTQHLVLSAQVAKLLGQEDAQLAERIGVSQPRVVRLEKAEVEDSLTLASLRKAAEAMDCTLVYVLLPREPLEELVRDRAEAAADRQIARTHHTMKLENQAVGAKDLKAERDRLVDELLRGDPSRLWDRT